MGGNREDSDGLWIGLELKIFSPILTPANVLGLGWACTPAGLKAMEELAKLEVERGNPSYASGGGSGVEMTGGKTGRIASNEMCTFLILNISSLQLIPVNMIAYRQQYSIFISCHYFFRMIFWYRACFREYLMIRCWWSFFMHEGIVHPNRMRYNSIEKNRNNNRRTKTYDIRKTH